MTMNRSKSAAERKAAERKRKRDAGLIPLEVWVLKDNKDKMRELEKKLQTK